MGKTALIARREFNERVKKRSFLITTILMPIAFVAMIAIIVYATVATGEKSREVVVVDRSGLIAPKLESSENLKFTPTDLTYEQVRDENREGLFGILVIGSDVVSKPDDISLYTYESSTVIVDGNIESQIQKIIEDEKLKNYNIDNLARILEEVKTDVSIRTLEISDTGEAKDSSSALSMGAAYIFGMLIFMFIQLYGMMVMQGVIEEKSNKVMELMVSSVKPYQLMMGKIIGIASVALLQLLIWIVFIAIAVFAIGAIFAGDIVEGAKSMQEGISMGGMMNVDSLNLSASQAALVSRLTDLGYILKLVAGFLLYFIGGYLLYASMFAAVGSSVDNEKDSANLQLPISIPLLIAFMITMSGFQDPNSPLIFWGSMIPFTSPIIMMVRLSYGVPMWELVLSLALLYATFLGMVWVAGKIYRVGIFMYGKKPTFKEIAKWVKYKS